MSGFVEKRRVVVQIAVGLRTLEGEVLYALADDGSLWWIEAEEPAEKEWAWRRLSEIPQGDED